MGQSTRCDSMFEDVSSRTGDIRISSCLLVMIWILYYLWIGTAWPAEREAMRAYACHGYQKDLVVAVVGEI